VPEVNENGLVERAKAYESEALSELYRRHAEAIFRYIYRRVGNRSVAEDLVGEVFVRALEDLPSYRNTGAPFGAWLYRIAHARVVDHYRRQKVRQNRPLDEHLPADERTNPDHLAIKNEATCQAWEALMHLTDEQQQVISFRFIAEYSIAEIARMLGKTEGAVKALQHRGLASLRRLLEKEQ